MLTTIVFDNGVTNTMSLILMISSNANSWVKSAIWMGKTASWEHMYVSDKEEFGRVSLNVTREAKFLTLKKLIFMIFVILFQLML